MGILSGMKFGRHGHMGDVGSAQAAVNGLGRVLQREAGAGIQLTKASRRVVADFIHGESSQASCSRSTGACDVESDGVRLRVGNYTIAERTGGLDEVIKVCIPPTTALTTFTAGRRAGKTGEEQSSREKRGAISALMQVIGSGIRVQRNSNNEHQFASGFSRRKGGRVLVPGQCVEVRLTPEMTMNAAYMLAATQMVKQSGQKVTRGRVRSAARGLRKQMAQKQAAAKKAARQQAAAARKAAKAVKSGGGRGRVTAAAPRALPAGPGGGGGAITVYQPRQRGRRVSPSSGRTLVTPPPSKRGPRRGPGGRFVKG